MRVWKSTTPSVAVNAKVAASQSFRWGEGRRPQLGTAANCTLQLICCYMGPDTALRCNWRLNLVELSNRA